MASAAERSRLMERCPDCGANLALVGSRHNCRPRAVSHPRPPLVTAPSPHTATPPPHASPHIEMASPHGRKGAVARNLRWRAKNLDRYRAYHAGYVRMWRARTAAPLAVNTGKELGRGRKDAQGFRLKQQAKNRPRSRCNNSARTTVPAPLQQQRRAVKPSR
jgi:hypothetical protein